METNNILSGIFNETNRNNAFALLSSARLQVESERPYGLSFGDLFHILDAFHSIGFRDQKVLEFGGCLSKEFIHTFLKPKLWHSVTLDIYDNSYIDNPNHMYRQGVNITSQENYLSSNLGLQYLHQLVHSGFVSPSYSRIFSVAAFEHLTQPYLSLHQLRQLLSDDALIYAFFSPVWSAPNGHHWASFPFELPQYIHLLHTYSSFIDYCISNFDMTCIDAEKHSYFIFKSPRINRLTPFDWMKLFSSKNGFNWKPEVINPLNIVDIDAIPTSFKDTIISSMQSQYLCDGYRVLAEPI